MKIHISVWNIGLDLSVVATHTPLFLTYKSFYASKMGAQEPLLCVYCANFGSAFYSEQV